MKYPSHLCPQTFLTYGECSAQEIGAVIAGLVALFALVVNLFLAVASLRLNLRSSNRTLEHQSKLAKLREEHEAAMKKKDHEHAIAFSEKEEERKSADRLHQLALLQKTAENAVQLEERRRFLDLQQKYHQETIDLQIKRLRDLRRACNQTLKDVEELAKISPALERGDMLVRTGDILRKSAVILAPADDKIPDLPEPCYGPLGKVRDSLVRVILSWNTEKEDRQPSSTAHLGMLKAVAEMRDAVGIFVPASQIEESQVMKSIIPTPDPVSP